MCAEITLERLAHFVLRTGHLSHLPLNDHVNQLYGDALRVFITARCLLSLLILPSSSANDSVRLIPSRSARKHTNSYRNLENARKAAAKKKNYDTHKTRAALADIFRERFGNNPYDWQLNVTEAIILGLDSIVIAGTGSGKTI